MNLRRRVLAGLAVVLPPNHLENLHAALRSRGRGIVLKQFRKYFFDQVRIFVTETSSLGQLRIHTPVEDVDPSFDSVLHAHGVGAALGSIALAADALRNLGARQFHWLETERRLHSDRATDRNRHRIGIISL